MDYDPFDARVHADPDPYFARLRAECPVHHHAARDFYTVARSADITDILRNPRHWSSRWRNGLTYKRVEGDGMLLDADPPTHTWQRRLVQSAWTPRLIARMERRVHTIVSARFDGFAGRGAADFHAEVSSQVPVTVIAELVGVPAADRANLQRWSDAGVAITGGMPGAVEAGATAAQELSEYMADHVARRRALLASGAAAPPDYTTLVMRATHDGRALVDHEIQLVLQLLLLGGIETTTLHLGNLLHRVIVEPDLATLLRADPSLDEIAVEESLRLDSPTLGLFRTPTAPVTVAGVDIPADAKTMVLFAAVNRDPERWECPDDFRLDRDPVELRRHYAFGHGVHLCLGAALARLEGRIVLRAIVERLPGVRYTAAPRRTPTMIFRGFDAQPIAWNADPNPPASAGAG